MKRISVILTTFNSEKYLQRTLDSIFNQNGINYEFEIELLVVDDQSKDNTQKILTANGIDFMSNSINSGGPNKGRNLGLRQASGDFICLMDHDDEWHPNKIRTQLSLTHIAPIITSGHTICDGFTNSKTEIVRSSNPDKLYHFFDINIVFLQKLSRASVPTGYIGSIMFASNLKNLEFEEHHGRIDFDWLLKLFHNNTSIEINASLYNRYLSPNNLSVDNEYRAIDFFYSLYAIENYFQRYPKHSKIGANRIIASRARYFYHFNKMRQARFWFFKSAISVKHIFYILTSFYGHSFVRRKFKVISFQ